MLKGQKKHIDKEQGKVKDEAPRSVNYRATQNKNNIGTTALEVSLWPVCVNSVEDEMHLLIKCDTYNNLRDV